MTQDFINNKTVENAKKHPWMLRVLKKLKGFTPLTVWENAKPHWYLLNQIVA